MPDIRLPLHVHPKQALVLRSEATEVLFGGAAGGGKSHMLRVIAILLCLAIAGLQVYLFRRVRDDVIATHIEGPKGFPVLLAPLIDQGLAKIVGDEIRFWNGAKVHLCHCKDEQDRFKYLSTEIHVLLIDELTTFTETVYRFLRSRVRAVGLKVPERWTGRLPLIVAASNPGNIGHGFVKATWVAPAQPLEPWQAPPEEGGMIRLYVPARLEDNPSLIEDDPAYEQKLEGLGSPELVRAYRHGDWDAIVGSFFPEFDRRRHVVEPEELPAHWLRYRAMDWGSAEPFSVLWFAVSDGEYPSFPRGALVVYREWYGMAEGKNNVGLRLPAETVGAGIEEREQYDGVRFGVLSPDAYREDGGPSIVERMGVRPRFEPADNTRVARRGHMGGWDQVRARLRGIPDGRPMLYIFSTCVHLIRTLPDLQHDERRPEDVAGNCEDHAPEALRYGVMARPYVAPKPAPPERKHALTIASLTEEARRKERVRARV